MFRAWRLMGIALLAMLCASAQETKRLILKDGSYQIVTRWEIRGDRLRYFSAERSAWEELPVALIDWPATDKFNSDEQKGARPLRPERAIEESPEDKAATEAARKAEIARTPEVAPGIRLPDLGGVYLLDSFQSRSALVELSQNNGELGKNLTRNPIEARINPLASMKQSIELPGARATVQAHGGQPAIYVSIEEANVVDPEHPATPLPQRYRLVRAQKKTDARIIGNLKIAVWGKVTQQENWQATRVEPVTSAWAKVTPLNPLPPGEYALVEVLSKDEINLYVWDFGIDPAAPENKSTWTSTPIEPAKTQPPPVLEQRPH